MQAPGHLPQAEDHPRGGRRGDAGDRERRGGHRGHRAQAERLCPPAHGKSDLAEAEFLRSAYEKSTLPFIRIDYATGEGLDDIKHWINGRLCAFCGNSGVGKSTLLNALLPDVERQTAAISQKLGRGRHTTREVTIFEAFGGRIADTPGFASLEAGRAGFIPKENLEHAFPEFGPYLGACQFTGCSHRSEKGCAVRAALAEGKLSQTRYDSYCAMYDEVKDVKEWQRRGL